MGKVEIAGQAVLRRRERPDQVEAQISQIGQQLLIEWLIMQLRSDHSKAAQGSSTGPKPRQGCWGQGQLGSDDDFLYLPFSGQHRRDRAADFQSQQAHGSRQLRGKHLVRRHTAPIQPFNGAQLARFQSRDVTKYFRNGTISS
jgi:hypothetical protein